MDTKKLANLLFPNITKTIDDWLNIYPPRNLSDRVEVLRLAPSPTGYLHLGNFYSAFIQYLEIQKKGGVFYLRLEDTDQKREIAGAGNVAYDMLCKYDVVANEGYRGNLSEIGDYGPYVQSHRVEIYQSFAKHLVALGNAFPCFCEKRFETKQDALDHREFENQENNGLREKDICRDLTFEEIEVNIKQNKTFAIRLKSKGNGEKQFCVHDVFLGKRMIRSNAKDIVVLKSNGVPPYSLAHLTDDILMHTTKVIRGMDWYPSVAAHIELFQAAGFNPIKYGHTPLICTLDAKTGNKRKLSKRYDPWADVRYYGQVGYPKTAVLEYLINLANSDFEIWRGNNPEKSFWEFPFALSKVGSNHPMFDSAKLENISKNIIARMTSEQIFEEVLKWSEEFNLEFYKYLVNNKEYVTNVFGIERGGKRAKKDIAKWSDVKQEFYYMFANPTTFEDDGLTNKKLRSNILNKYAEIYSRKDDQNIWFDKIKKLAISFNFADKIRKYADCTDDYVGDITNFVTVLRVALTGKCNGPNLFELMQILGEEKSKERLLTRSLV